jgi:hypothetical protein
MVGLLRCRAMIDRVARPSQFGQVHRSFDRKVNRHVWSLHRVRVATTDAPYSVRQSCTAQPDYASAYDLRESRLWPLSASMEQTLVLLRGRCR